MLKKTITWAIVAFLAVFMLANPVGAAGVIHGGLTLLKDAGNSLGAFVHSL